MKVRTFREKMASRTAEVNSCVCLGLDSDWEKLPAFLKKGGRVLDALLNFNQLLIDATYDLLLAIKLNASFYEQHGPTGKYALMATIKYLHRVAPGVIAIVDYKRADIGNSNLGYVAEAFGYFVADAVTVNPYFGREAMWPFLNRQDKGIIVLCKTSNPGSDEFQDLMVRPVVGASLAALLDNDGQLPLYQYVAYRVSQEWNRYDNCALVVGGTYPEQTGEVRKAVGNMPLLIPGLGKQGGTAQEVVPVAQDSQGGGMIINSSRDIIFASAGSDFAEAARQKTIELRDEINRYRQVA